MFKKITLENFKGFATNQSIEIKPITLIYGANSSGKSSILQSLLLMKQTLEQSNDPNAILLSKGKYIDLGNFNEFINNHDTNKKLKIRLDLPVINDRFMYRSQKNGKSIDIAVEIIYTQNKLLEIDQYNIYLNNESFISLKRTFDNIKAYSHRYYPRILRKQNNDIKKSNYEISNINYGNEYFKKIYEYFLEQFPKNEDEKFLKNLENREKNDEYQKYNKLRDFIINKEEKKIQEEIFKYCKRYIFNFTNFLPNICLRREQIEESLIESLTPYILREKRLLPYIDDLVDISAFIVSDVLSKIHYLGPLRKNPERYYVSSGNTSDYVGKTGLESPDILYENENNILNKTNKWLRKLTNYSIKPTATTRKTKDKGSQNVYSLRLVDAITNTNVNITDLGFGISQILPIIVQSFKSNGDLILIEQPEIHIHPKLQAEMGSMFAEACKNNMFIIETHSENLLLRLKKLVRTGKISNDQISIIYVDKTEQGSVCCPIRLDDNGDFIDKWPKGFFEESLEELF